MGVLQVGGAGTWIAKDAKCTKDTKGAGAFRVFRTFRGYRVPNTFAPNVKYAHSVGAPLETNGALWHNVVKSK